jgi:transcription elongation factor GreB
MNKAFTKEDASEAPVVIPRRAPLPPGVPNYVTARGLALLRSELADLQQQRVTLIRADSDDAERMRQLAIVDARLAELAARVASAQVVDHSRQPRDEVRFGATVTLRCARGAVCDERRLTIVGVDEAAPADGRVAFLSPIARAVTGLRVGDATVFTTAAGDEELEVTAISYPVD